MGSCGYSVRTAETEQHLGHSQQHHEGVSWSLPPPKSRRRAPLFNAWFSRPRTQQQDNNQAENGQPMTLRIAKKAAAATATRTASLPKQLSTTFNKTSVAHWDHSAVQRKHPVFSNSNTYGAGNLDGGGESGVIATETSVAAMVAAPQSEPSGKAGILNYRLPLTTHTQAAGKPNAFRHPEHPERTGKRGGIVRGASGEKKPSSTGSDFVCSLDHAGIRWYGRLFVGTSTVCFSGSGLLLGGSLGREHKTFFEGSQGTTTPVPMRKAAATLPMDNAAGRVGTVDEKKGRLWRRTAIRIQLRDITRLSKELTMGFWPNALTVATAQRQYIFTNFLRRDRAHKCLVEAWERQGAKQNVHPGTGMGGGGGGGGERRPRAIGPPSSTCAAMSTRTATTTAAVAAAFGSSAAEIVDDWQLVASTEGRRARRRSKQHSMSGSTAASVGKIPSANATRATETFVSESEATVCEITRRAAVEEHPVSELEQIDEQPGTSSLETMGLGDPQNENSGTLTITPISRNPASVCDNRRCDGNSRDSQVFLFVFLALLLILVHYS